MESQVMISVVYNEHRLEYMNYLFIFSKSDSTDTCQSPELQIEDS